MALPSLVRLGGAVAFLFHVMPTALSAEFLHYPGIDRASIAFDLFEAHCLPFLHDERNAPPAGSSLFEPIDLQIMPGQIERRKEWRHVETDLHLVIDEELSGEVECSVSDTFVGLSRLHSFRFKSLVNTRLTQRFRDFEKKEGTHSTEISADERHEIFVQGWDLGVSDFDHRILVAFLAEQKYDSNNALQKQSSSLSLRSTPCKKRCLE